MAGISLYGCLIMADIFQLVFSVSRNVHVVNSRKQEVPPAGVITYYHYANHETTLTEQM